MSSFLKGVGLVILFSCIFALIAYIFDANYWKWFWVVFVGQFIAFSVFNMALKTWAQIQVNKLRIVRMNAIDKNIKPIRCVACGELNDVYIDVKDSEGLTFKCSKCGVNTSVIVSITNALKTDILYDSEGVLTEEKIKDLIDGKNQNI